MRAALFFLFSLTAIPAVAAEPNTQANVPGASKFFGKQENFVELRRERRRLLSEANVLERDIHVLEKAHEQLTRELTAREGESRSLANEISSLDIVLRSKSPEGPAAKRPAPAAAPGRPVPGGPAGGWAPKSEIEFLESLAVQDLTVRKTRAEQRQRELNEKSARVITLQNEIKKKREELEAKTAVLSDLEEKIAMALDIEKNRYVYRSIVSFIFATIVFFLVLKFFRVVETDDSVKKSIFAGGAGIQFITLFSIVIAVILFGILEILGANELSALLGGLSGYILGQNRQGGPANQNGA